MILNFTPTDLKQALQTGCLTNQQRLHLVDVIEGFDDLTDSAKVLRKQHNSFENIITAAIILGFEAGAMLSSKIVAEDVEGSKE